MRILGLVVLCAIPLAAPMARAQEQLVDPEFESKVAAPAYTADGPRVVIDEAHGNFHTASGQYVPFAALLRADGYAVAPGKAAFDAQGLAQADVLVIANAGCRVKIRPSQLSSRKRSMPSSTGCAAGDRCC